MRSRRGGRGRSGGRSRVKAYRPKRRMRIRKRIGYRL